MKKKNLKLILFGFSGFFLSFLFYLISWSQEGNKVPFPEDIKSLIQVEEGEIEKGNPLMGIIPGLHRTYLNDIAYEHFKKYIVDYKAGKTPPPFPEGSYIVLVNYEDKEGKKPRLFIVMHKKKEYGQTGGWGWEAFKPDGTRIVRNPDKDCTNCHYKGTKDWDGTFFSHYK